jgi:hypothetical protein
VHAADLQVREGRPVVGGVYVNGRGPYIFLLDTGSNVNLIETGLARKIGMNSTFQSDLASAVGKTAMLGSTGHQVALDAVKADGQTFLLSKSKVIHRFAPHVQGVLGQSFLSKFDYTLDLRGKRLEFGKRYPDGKRSRFRIVNARPVVSTSLGDLVLDSGAAQLVLFGVDPDTQELTYMRTVAGSQMVGTVSRRLIIEDRYVWHGDAIAMPKQAEPEVAGLMPTRLFKTIFVCNSEGYVVFD